MDALAVRQEENKALLAQVVESKMTRGELLDLIVDRVSAELKAEADQIDAERRTAQAEVSLSLANAIALVRKAEAPCVELGERYNGWGEHRTRLRTLTISVTLPEGVELPRKYVAAAKRLADIEKRLDDVRSKRRRLDAGKVRARNEMVRHALESTPQGARILEAIESFKETLTERLVSPTP